MTEYTLLAHAASTRKGSVVIKVLSIGELKAGTGGNGDWTKKEAIVRDSSGDQQLTLWNDDIKKIEQGKIYKLENPFWTEYQGKAQLTIGKFCKIYDATEADMLPSDGTAPQTTAQSTSTRADPQREPASNTDAIQFAEKCVTSYITICIGNGLTKETIAAGTSAVYNTALMQKMRK